MSEIQAMNIRLSRLEVAMEEAVATINQQAQTLSSLMNDPAVMASLAQSSGMFVLQQLKEIGLDAIDPAMVATISTKEVDEFSIRLVFNSDDVFAPGAFSVFARNPDNGNEFDELTSIRRRQYDVIISAVAAYKRKKLKGTELWINLATLPAAATVAVGEAANATSPAVAAETQEA